MVITLDNDDTDIGRDRFINAGRRVSDPVFLGGGGGKFIGDAAPDEKDVPESLRDVPALMGDKTLAVLVLEGLACASFEEVVSASDRIVDATVEVGRRLLGGE